MYVALGATLEACVLIVGSLQAGDLGLERRIDDRSASGVGAVADVFGFSDPWRSRVWNSRGTFERFCFGRDG
jgi:hypothetical protein